MKKLFYLIKLGLFDNKKENYKFFYGKLLEEFPKGLLLLHEGRNYYVKDFSGMPDILVKELDWDSDKLYIITEFFDEDKKEFSEKYFHEDFFRNRLRVMKQALGEDING